jgi:hypothetical protein
VLHALLLQYASRREQRRRALQLRHAVARQRVQQIGRVELRAHHQLRAGAERGSTVARPKICVMGTKA